MYAKPLDQGLAHSKLSVHLKNIQLRQKRTKSFILNKEFSDGFIGNQLIIILDSYLYCPFIYSPSKYPAMIICTITGPEDSEVNKNSQK